MRSDLKKLDFFTLETLKNHLIRIFLRDGRLRVKTRCPEISKLGFLIKGIEDCVIINRILL